MKPNEIRDLNPGDIREKIKEQEEELANMRIRLVTRQLDNPILIRDSKREIARLKTVLHEHELGIRELSNT
jgi:large subunit ribosomal protein L29